MSATPESLSTVAVTIDPELAAADPDLMATVADDFQSAARGLYHLSGTVKSAAAEVVSDWQGKGVQGFKSAMSNPQTGLSQDAMIMGAAEALIGASIALNNLSTAIGAAQRQAQGAQSLASETNASVTRLQTSYGEYRTQAVAALPPHVRDPEDVAAATAPTGAQITAATNLASAQSNAVSQMKAANGAAQAAWQRAEQDFDAVTAQSPSVQWALFNKNLSVYEKEIDKLGIAAIFAAEAGSVEPGGDDDDPEDPGGTTVGEGEGEGTNSDGNGDESALDVELSKLDLAADGDVEVDGTTLDPTIAEYYNGIQVGWSDAETIQQSFEQLALDPVTAPMFANTDPFGGNDPQSFNTKYWDPDLETPYGKGGWRYPPDDGADTTMPSAPKTFTPNETFDRFGPAGGNFASPVGTPYEARSLPPTNLLGGTSSYHVYQVTPKWTADPPPVTVTQQVVANAFDQPGGGVQYVFKAQPGSGITDCLTWLNQHGYLTVTNP